MVQKYYFFFTKKNKLKREPNTKQSNKWNGALRRTIHSPISRAVVQIFVRGLEAFPSNKHHVNQGTNEWRMQIK